MTREEAIKILSYLRPGCGPKPICTEEEECEAIDLALSALRGPTREMLEKMRRGEWLHDPETGYEHCDKCSHTISLDDYMNRKPPLFCEMCGDAKTDEAVQMVMERMEKLYEQTSN